jgi:hypothetical protein
MSSSPKVIALFTTREGHLSIAQALTQSLRGSFNTKQFYFSDPLFRIYLPIYQMFPDLFGLPYKLTKQEKVVLLSKYINTVRYRQKVANFLDSVKPDLCVNTYFMFNQSLEQECQERNIPFINVTTDPRAFHPIFWRKMRV